MFWNKPVYLKNTMFVVAAILLILLIMQMKEIALLIFASFVLACSLNPAVDKLSTKMPRSLASTIVITGAILVAVLFLIPIVSISIKEIQQVFNNIPLFIKNIIDFMSNKTIMGKPIIEYVDINALTNTSSQMASGIVNKSINFTVAFMEAITIVITMGVIVFYMVNEKNLVRDAIVLIFPPKMKKRAKEVYENIEHKVGGYVIAQVLSMSTVAIFTAIGLMILKVQYAVLLGLIAGILDIVPIVGPTVAFILGVLCASQQGWLIVLLTVVVYLAAQWVSNNFVRPLVFGKFLDLHPLIIIFAFLISAQFLGVWGVILSPAIAALLLTLFDELYLKTINGRQEKMEEDEK
ncbi:TPA: AI-2E family transporter [Candidatus Avigastranaerophilus faecigallinarum]|nr:AI-2E family transporter [Candidatus Avigastranaerophilus faecigallinarum]